MPANNPAAYGLLDSIFGRRQGRGYPEDMNSQQAILELLEKEYPLEQPSAGTQVAAATLGRGIPRFQQMSDVEMESISAGQGTGTQALQELLSRIDHGTYGTPGEEAVPTNPDRFTPQQKALLKQAAIRHAKGR